MCHRRESSWTERRVTSSDVLLGLVKTVLNSELYSTKNKYRLAFSEIKQPLTDSTIAPFYLWQCCGSHVTSSVKGAADGGWGDKHVARSTPGLCEPALLGLYPPTQQPSLPPPCRFNTHTHTYTNSCKSSRPTSSVQKITYPTPNPSLVNGHLRGEFANTTCLQWLQPVM